MAMEYSLRASFHGSAHQWWARIARQDNPGDPRLSRAMAELPAEIAAMLHDRIEATLAEPAANNAALPARVRHAGRCSQPKPYYFQSGNTRRNKAAPRC